MRNEQALALQITFFIFIFFCVFWSIFLFIFSDSVSIKDLFYKLFDQKVIFWKDVIYFYSYVIVKTIAILFWIYFISYFFAKKLFSWVNEYNKKLKDYNHFLAHELKTPISIIYSNLDVLKYWFNKDKITKSQKELKNMIKIIDWLLNFSDSVKISNKKDINLENFVNSYVYFLDKKDNIKIINKEFNFSINTDEVLFWRVIKNLIDNALKYSLSKKVKVYIKSDRLIFENSIEETLEKKEIDAMLEKFFRKSFDEKKWHWIWLPMIKEIVKVLWYKMKIKSEDKRFVVEIIY